MTRCLFLLLLATATFAAPEMPVQTASGPVTGMSKDGVVSYLGLPFAAPPVGELRWQPPRPPAPWTQPRACTAFGEACPQDSSDSPFDRGRAEQRQSEDCLTLNVWAPAERGAARPVMVWIHGGGLVNGSGGKEYYDGSKLVRKGVVVVSINYRLGPFGFLTHAELGAGPQGNWGFLDQVAALRWVRDNIAGFGGDPGRVTIFGESAGALSTCTLLASPAARGLFHRAIVQSGAASSNVRTIADSQAMWRQKLSAAGVRDLSLAALRKLPASELVKAYHGIGATPGTSGHDMMTLDGTVLTESPADSFAGGRQAPVPVIVGSNRDEGTLFGQRGAPKTRQQLNAVLARLSPAHAADVLRVYPAATDEQAAATYVAALGDASFTATARRTARWHAAAGQPTWRYWFCQTTALADRMGLGAFHGAEIPFVFGNVDGVVYRADHKRLSEQMTAHWVRFATDGRPADGWTRYDAARDNVMVFETQSRMQDGVRAAECDLWDRVAAGGDRPM